MLRLITSRSLTALTTLTTLLAPGACGDDSPGSGSDELPITSVGETPPPTTTVDPTDLHDAGPGWGLPTGWGAPRARYLADALA